MVRLVCESSSGYICKLLNYDGSGMKLEERVPELLQAYLHQGYQAYMDNYLNCTKLLKDLHSFKANLNMWYKQKKQRAAQIIQATIFFFSKRGNDIHERRTCTFGCAA
ncbi:hypothetical protein PR048_000353 [Dryococelus australis]|uniref:PiggyBac transposable element-derived protein domain-containing protein n=1 Tax=Dryococelus australis TaxID=614101 RepID=A0ABQ9IFP2_9NEOP|nr:hypothetical protein PR048_000353 [Dryococelus australis]